MFSVNYQIQQNRNLVNTTIVTFVFPMALADRQAMIKLPPEGDLTNRFKLPEQEKT